jgi:hypothetical protein
LRLPPDADGIVQNSAGISLDYFRSVSCLNRLLFLISRRSIFHPGFSRTASVGFRRRYFIPFKEPHLVAGDPLSSLLPGLRAQPERGIQQIRASISPLRAMGFSPLRLKASSYACMFCR